MNMHRNVAILFINLFLTITSLFSYDESGAYYFGGIIFPEKKVDGVLLERVGEIINIGIGIELCFRLNNTTSRDITMNIIFPVCEKVTITPDGEEEHASEYPYNSLKILYKNEIYNKDGSIKYDFFRKDPLSLKRVFKITKENDDMDMLGEYGYGSMEMDFAQDDSRKAIEYILIKSEVVNADQYSTVLITYNYCYRINLIKQKTTMITMILNIIMAPVFYEEFRFWTGSGLEWEKPIPRIGCFCYFPFDTIPWKGSVSGTIQEIYYSVQNDYIPGIMDEITASHEIRIEPYENDDKDEVKSDEKKETGIPAILNDDFMIQCMKKMGIDTGIFFDKKNFFNAVEKGDAKKVENYLARGMNANTVTENGTTALMLAAKLGYLPVVKILLDYNAYIDHKNNSKNTALHFAVYNKHNTIVEYLIKRYADINAEGYQKQTPLVLAAEIRNNEAVRLLVENKADLHIFDSNDRTALTYAFINKDKELVQYLKPKFSDHLTKKDRIEFGNAVNSFDTKKIIRYIGMGIDVNQPVFYDEANYDSDDTDVHAGNSTTALMVSLEKKNSALAEFLLKAGADVNDVRYDQRSGFHYTRSPVMFALGGDRKILKMILEAGVKKLDETLFLTSNTEEAKLLLEYKADVNQYLCGRTPLHNAAECNYAEMVRFLLQNGADINAKVKDYDEYCGYFSVNGETPIMRAVIYEHADIVKILLDYGADTSIRVVVDCTNCYGESMMPEYTALDLAKESKNKKIIQLLTEAARKK